MKLKTLFFGISIVVLCLQLPVMHSFAQPSIQWQKCFGGSALDAAYSTVPTSDGGFIMVGETKSVNGDVTGYHGGGYADVWVVKTDSAGTIAWQKCLGGTAHDYGESIIQTIDGGYIVAGSSASNDGDVSGNHGSYDAWIIKLSSIGAIQWQKSYGGTNVDIAQSIVQTPDGGYIFAGSTLSNDGDVSGNHGYIDAWVVKIDNAGTIEWQKCLGGSSSEGKQTIGYVGTNQRNICIQLTNDGGYIFAGYSDSNDGDVTGHHGPSGTVTIGGVYYGYNTDCWIVKLDNTGTIQWQKCLGGSGIDAAYTILQTNDGGYIFAGNTGSTDYDVSGHHPIPGPIAAYDLWLVRIDASGIIQWQKCIGGRGYEFAYSISATNDNGYFITGITTSPDGDAAGAHGSIDNWAVKTDIAGNIQWQKCLGGTNKDFGASGFQTSDGGYIVAASVSSSNGDVIANHGNYDFRLVKLSPVPVDVITGTVYEDLNGNCVKDTNETGLPGKIIRAVPGNYFASTDANGNYSLFVDSGSYTISTVAPQYYSQSCPAASGTYNVTISSATPNSFGNNFADTLTSHCPDLKVSIGTPFFRRCFKNIFSVFYYNTGAVAAVNVSITVNFDNLIIPLSSTIPWTKIGNDYVFTIDTIKPGNSGHFNIVDSVSCAAIIGLQTECTWASIHSATAECDTTNNTAHDCHIIVGSCDPNAKEVASQDFESNGYVSQENITPSDTLIYMIRFQNTGTDTAFTVVIRDTLSSNLDASSVQTGASSHQYSFRIYGQGILEWTFNDIHLSDSASDELGSHGFVKFTVHQKANNIQGTVINNNADIVFDYNSAIKTNTAVVIIPLITGISATTSINEITKVFPNPFNSSFTIQSSEELGLIILYNSIGEIIYQKKINSTEEQIDFSSQPAGIYFLENQNTFLKIIKE